MPDCKKCGNSFPNAKNIDGKRRTFYHRSYCFDCSPFGKHNTKKLEQTNRQKKNVKSVTNYRKKSRIKALEYKGNKCIICGYNKCTRALSFHHINKEIKLFAISEAWTCSWEKLKTEVDKCVLLCANCHMEVESGITEIPI